VYNIKELFGFILVLPVAIFACWRRQISFVQYFVLGFSFVSTAFVLCLLDLMFITKLFSLLLSVKSSTRK
jgi:hypothetical protein